jgi:hypothetical protein
MQLDKEFDFSKNPIKSIKKSLLGKIKSFFTSTHTLEVSYQSKDDEDKNNEQSESNDKVTSSNQLLFSFLFAVVGLYGVHLGIEYSGWLIFFAFLMF